MADHLLIRRSEDHRYFVSVMVAGYHVEAEIDTAFTQPACNVGLGLERGIYGGIRGRLTNLARMTQYLAGEQPEMIECGLATVSIVRLDDSEIETRVADAGSNLLGTCYFHRLSGYEVVWDLEAGEMTIQKKAL